MVRGVEEFQQGVALGDEFFQCVIVGKVKRDYDAGLETMPHILTHYRRFASSRSPVLKGGHYEEVS